jgi:hypothetical protein
VRSAGYRCSRRCRLVGWTDDLPPALSILSLDTDEVGAFTAALAAEQNAMSRTQSPLEARGVAVNAGIVPNEEFIKLLPAANSTSSRRPGCRGNTTHEQAGVDVGIAGVSGLAAPRGLSAFDLPDCDDARAIPPARCITTLPRTSPAATAHQPAEQDHPHGGAADGATAPLAAGRLDSRCDGRIIGAASRAPGCEG